MPVPGSAWAIALSVRTRVSCYSRFCGYEPKNGASVMAITWQLTPLLVPVLGASVGRRGVAWGRAMQSVEVMDIGLAAFMIILVSGLLLAFAF
jgi:hypothetical protein